MGGSAPTSLRLNGRDVDLQRGVVAKTSGTTVTLRPQAAAVLQVLAARQGKLVSKDELVAAVWRGVAVTDDSLVQCIAEIRKALGDDRHTVVKTVLKRGYMLAVEPGAQQFWRKRSILAAAGVLASIIAAGSLLLSFPGSARKPPSLAILPFENLGGETSWSGFANGLTEDIIADLARSAQIPVVEAARALPARLSPQDLRKVAQDLSVRYVLHGTFRVDGYRMRVTARLIAADTGINVWSEQYDRPAERLLDVQDDITQRIAVTLTGWQGEINKADRAVARHKGESELDPYDYWLLGIEAKHRMTPDSMGAARRYFSKGLELAPDFMPLVRDWAITYGVQMDLGAPIDFPAAVEAQRRYAERAFLLDPGDAIATYQMGLVSNLQGKSEQAEFYFQHAAELGRGNSDIPILLSWVLAGTDPGRAMALIEKAVTLNPGHPSWWNFPITEAFFSSRRFDEAYAAASRMGTSPNQSAFVSMSAAQTGKLDVSAKAKLETLRLNPAWTAESMFPYQVFSDDALLIQSAEAAGLPVCMNQAQAQAFTGAHRFAWCEEQRSGKASAQQGKRSVIP